jgi:hypothetical protein
MTVVRLGHDRMERQLLVGIFAALFGACVALVVVLKRKSDEKSLPPELLKPPTDSRGGNDAV